MDQERCRGVGLGCAACLDAVGGSPRWLLPEAASLALIRSSRWVVGVDVVRQDLLLRASAHCWLPWSTLYHNEPGGGLTHWAAAGVQKCGHPGEGGRTDGCNAPGSQSFSPPPPAGSSQPPLRHCPGLARLASDRSPAPPPPVCETPVSLPHGDHGPAPLPVSRCWWTSGCHVNPVLTLFGDQSGMPPPPPPPALPFQTSRSGTD